MNLNRALALGAVGSLALIFGAVFYTLRQIARIEVWL